MQGSTGQSGNQNGQKQGGLSWTQSPSNSGSVSSNINSNAGGAKPISQVQPSARPVNNTPNKAPSMPSNSSAKKNDASRGSGARAAGVFVAGVIVGLVIGWGWFSLGRDQGKVATSDTGAVAPSNSENAAVSSTSGTHTGTPKPATSTSGSGSASASTGSASGLAVESQSAGLSVSVSSVSVSAPTWVVIFEDVGGNPGNALGAKLFFPGEASGVVELLRGTIAGKTYFAGEYVDNGDHQFSKQTDMQVETAAGTPLLVQFTVR